MKNDKETLHRQKKQASHHLRWDKRVIKSVSDEESVDPNSEWSQYDNERTPCVNGDTFDENEWSLMTSLIRLFGFPYEQSASRSFWGNALLMHFLL